MKKSFSLVIIILSMVLLLGLCFSSFAGNHTDKENTFENSQTQAVDYSSLVYTALGDSITWGAYNGIQIEKSYSVLVGENLDLISVKNMSKGGYTLSKGSLYGSIQDAVNYVPTYSNIVSVLGGTNDFAQSMPLGSIDNYDVNTIYGGLHYIAKTLINRCPNAFIFFMTALPLGDTKLEQYHESERTIEEINIAIKEVADLYGIFVLDTYSLANFQNVMNDKSVCDGCHPSPDFHKDNFAPLITKFIKDNYNK